MIKLAEFVGNNPYIINSGDELFLFKGKIKAGDPGLFPSHAPHLFANALYPEGYWRIYKGAPTEQTLRLPLRPAVIGVSYLQDESIGVITPDMPYTNPAQLIQRPLREVILPKNVLKLVRNIRITDLVA